MTSFQTTDIQINQAHLDLISKIYDLPLKPERWPLVLDQFTAIMNAGVAGIMVHDPMTAERQLSVMSSNFSPALLESYNNKVSLQSASPFTKMTINPKREFWTELEMNGLDHIDEYKKRPTSQWLSKNLNVLHGMSSCLNLDRSWTDILLILFPDTRGPITPKEKQLAALFLDHFAKAMEINRSFSLLNSRFDGVLTALDRFHIGIFVLSPNGNVIQKNAEADRILFEDDGVCLTRERHLQTKESDRRAELKIAINQASSTAEGKNDCAQTLMTLNRASGKDPYLLEVSPFRDDDELESQFSGCLVFVIDPAKTDVVSTSGMRKIYNLTPSESEVCRLVAEGLETDDIAETRNLTRETVRDYVKKILRKTGTNNRSQLVRLALSVNLPIDPANSTTLPAQDKK